MFTQALALLWQDVPPGLPHLYVQIQNFGMEHLGQKLMIYQQLDLVGSPAQ